MEYHSDRTGANVDELLDKIEELEVATTSTDGLMSSEDKASLDSIGQKFNDGIAKTDLASDVQTSLGKADTALQAFTETDPTVPSWAKASSKPTYTASEVGALPDDTPLFSGDYNDLSNTPTIPDISGKADKATTLSGYGITDAKIVSGTITLGSSTITPLTSAHEIPSGGNAGQVLSKNSATDYDVHWVNQTTTYPSAYCTTAAGTAAKKASCSLWTATANTYLHILIGADNTSASALTLNVNSTGARPIYINGSASSSSNYTLPAGSYIAFYDGTNFHINTDGTIPRAENTSNKVTSLSSSSTDTQYPSAKCVYDIIGDIETLLAAL